MRRTWKQKVSGARVYRIRRPGILLCRRNVKRIDLVCRSTISCAVSCKVFLFANIIWWRKLTLSTTSVILLCQVFFWDINFFVSWNKCMPAAYSYIFYIGHSELKYAIIYQSSQTGSFSPEKSLKNKQAHTCSHF